jgi:hypothetical protein
MRSKTVYFRRFMTKFHYFTTTRCIDCVRNNIPEVVAETKQEGSLEKGRNFSTKGEWTRK